MTTWFVRVLRFDGQKTLEQKYSNYVDAKIAFDKIDKISDDKQESAGGRIKLQADNGITLNMAFVA